LLREFKNKRLYRVSSYYVARTTGELPFQMSFPMIYVTIVYWMVWQSEWDRFLLVVLTLQAACFTGASFGYMLSTLSTDFDMMMVLSIVFLLTVFLFSGMLIDITTLPSVLQAFSNASLFKHAFDAGMIAVWQNVDLQCDAGEECLYEDGIAVLRNYNVTPSLQDRLLRALLALALLSIVARVVGFVRIWSRYVLEDDFRNLIHREPKPCKFEHSIAGAPCVSQGVAIEGPITAAEEKVSAHDVAPLIVDI